MLLMILAFIAVVLTLAMFISRQAMLGFACVIFWSLFGADCIVLSAAPWDVYFTTGFGAMLGMNILCGMGAFGLREKRDTGTDRDEYIDESGERSQYIGETRGEANQTERADNDDSMSDDMPRDNEMDRPSRPSARTKDLHKRSEQRKTGFFRKKNPWGEFK